MAFPLRLFLVTLVSLFAFIRSAQAQITVTSVTTNQICAGATMSCSYTTNTGVLKDLAVYLFNDTNYADSTLLTQITTTNATGTIAFVIPGNSVEGRYSIKVKQTTATPVITSSISPKSPSGLLFTVHEKLSVPTVPNVSLRYCVGVTTEPLKATATGSSKLVWYDDNGLFVYTAPAPRSSVNGIFVYSVSQTDPTGCESDKVNIPVTINANPVAPATTSLFVCQNTTPVSLSTVVTATYRVLWYDVASGGSGTVVAPFPSTTTVKQDIFYVSQLDNNFCQSSRAPVAYIVKSTPAAPAVTAFPITYCQDVTTAVSLSAIPSATGTLNWYSVQSGGTAAASLIPSTASSNDYYVSQTVNGCEGPRASLSVSINAKPVPPLVRVPAAYCPAASAAPFSATALPNNTLLWYGTTATGGRASTVAPTPDTKTSGVFNYYVSQQDPLGCESDRAMIPVTVFTKPAPPSTSPLSLCQNATPVSLASAVAAPGTLRWYAANTGGTAATVPPTPPTASVGRTIYYVSQVDGNGCESDRAAVSFTVNPRPAAPVAIMRTMFICQDVVQVPLDAIGTGTINWYTTRTGGTPVQNLVPPTSVSGGFTYYVGQTDGNGCEGPRDSTLIIVGSRPALPQVATLPVYCQNTIPVSLSATPLTGNTLQWYGTNETGGTASLIATTPTTTNAGSTPYYVSQLDNMGCESKRASLVVTVNARPAAPTTVPVSLCYNSSVPLVSSGVTATGTLNWYSSPSSSATIVAPTLSNTLVGPITYYVNQTDANGCVSDKAPVVVNPLPTTPLVSASPVLFCQNSVATPLSATTGAGTLRWYDPAGNAFNSLTPPTDVVGPFVYKVSQAVNGCESPPASLTAIIIRKAAIPTVAGTISYCQLETPVQLTASGEHLAWYTTSTGGASTSVAPVLSSNTAGTTIYYVTQTDANGCESDRASISVQVKAKPSVPGTAPVSFCINQVTALSATADAGGSLSWFGTSAIGGTPTPTAPVPTTDVIGAPIPYYVSQTVNGCESARVALAVTIKGLPLAPSVGTSPVVYCQGATSLPLSATGSGSLNWYSTLTGGTASTLAPVPQTAISNPVTSYYYVSQVVNGCEGPRATIAVTINATPPLPVVTPSLVYCQNTTAPGLSAIAAGTLSWYTDAVGGTTIPTPVPLTTIPASTTYYVSQTDANGCVSGRASSTVTIPATPTAPTTTPVSYCQNAPSTALTAIVGPGGSLNWYTTPTGGVSTTIAPSPPTSATGTSSYYVSQVVNGCEGPRTAIVVTINSLPTAPTVAANSLQFCQNAPATPLTATAEPGGSLNWYTTPTGGSSAASAPSPPTSAVGTGSYYVSQVVNGCEGPRTAISVTVKSLPAAPGASASPFVFCQGSSSIVLPVTPAAGGSLNWYTTPTSSTPSSTAPVSATTSAGVYAYYVSQTITGCEGPQIPVVVLIQATPSAPTIGNSPVYCQGGSATALSATASAGGTLNWYTTQTGGLAASTPPTPPVNAAGTVAYYVSQSINGCEGPRDLMTATIKAAPSVPAVITSFTYCQNATSAPLTAAAGSGGTLNWYTAQTGGTSSAIVPVPATSVAGLNQYYVSQTDATGCESNRATITVKINALPAAPTTSAVSYCQSTTAIPLNATPTSGGILNWYAAQTGGISSAVAPIPATSVAGPIMYYVSQTDASGCESVRSLAFVVVTASPVAPTVAPMAPVCQNSLPVALQATGQSLKWYTSATSATSVGSSVTQATTLAGTFVYYVSQTINQCESPRTLVQAVVNALPSAPTVANQTGCQDAVVQSLTAVGTALQWFDINDNLITTPTPVTKVDINQTYIYKVTQTINGCSSAKALLIYTVAVTPPPTVVSPMTYCQSGTAKPLQASGTGLKWTDPSGLVTTVAPTPATATMTAGASYSVSQTSLLGCESRKAEIKVVINALPTAKLEGLASISLGESAALSLTLTGAGPYNYTLSDGTGGIIATAPNSELTISKITVSPAVSTTYAVATISNACGNGSTTGLAPITVTVPVITTGTLPVATICTGAILTVPFTTSGKFTAGNAFTVEIASTGTDSLNRKYIPVSTGVVQGGNLVTTLPGTVAPGVYYIRVSGTNAPYPIWGSKSPTLLTVKVLPTAVLSVSKKAVYKGESTELYVTLSGDAPWTVGYLAGLEAISLGTTRNLTSVTVTPAATTTYKLTSVANSCGSGKIEGVDTTTIRVDILLAESDPFGSTVKVYPVPTEGTLTVDIDLPLQKEPAQLQLTSADGYLTEQLSTRQKQTSLSLDKVPAGVYLLHITIGKQSTIRRIIKQ